MTITTRIVKGSELTWAELDANFTDLVAGVVAERAASTSLVLDALDIDYAALTISGATAFTVSGTKRSARASIIVMANGTNIPTVSGADEWASSFGYLNTNGVPNRLDVWHDGTARRYAWSQQMVPVAIDTVAPTLSSAIVNASSLTLTYSEILNATAPATSAFSVVGAAGATQTPSGASISGAVVTLTLASPAVSGNTVTVNYTVPGSNPLQDLAGNAAASLTSQAVTNNTALSSDGDVSAWLIRVASNGGSVSVGTKTAVETFVASAKASGYWTSFRRLNLMCGADIATALTPLVNTSGSASDTNVGTTYAEATGLSTAGAQYLRTGYVPSEATGGLSVYLRTTQASDTTQHIAMGVRDSGSTQLFRIIGNSTETGAASAGGVSSNWGGSNSATPGYGTSTATGGMVAAMWHVRRRGSTTLALYKNGASVGTSVETVTPATSTNDLSVFGGWNGTTAAAPLASGSSVGAYAVDNGMTDAHAAAFYTHMQTFQTALSRNV